MSPDGPFLCCTRVFPCCQPEWQKIENPVSFKSQLNRDLIDTHRGALHELLSLVLKWKNAFFLVHCVANTPSSLKEVILILIIITITSTININICSTPSSLQSLLITTAVSMQLRATHLPHIAEESNLQGAIFILS